MDDLGLPLFLETPISFLKVTGKMIFRLSIGGICDSSKESSVVVSW